MFVVLKYLVLIFRFEVYFCQVDYFLVVVVEGLEEDIAVRELLMGGDVDVLWLELLVVPLEEFFL